jgi:hypothetical protein
MSWTRRPYWIAPVLIALVLFVLFVLNGCGRDQPAPRTDSIAEPVAPADSFLADTAPSPARETVSVAAVVPSVDTTIRWDTVSYGDTLRQAERTVIITSTTQERDSVIVLWQQPPLVLGIGVGAYFSGDVFGTGIPAPMNIGVGPTSPDQLIAQLALAKQKKHRRALFLPDGSHTPILTNGKFDIAKWKSRMRVFATPALKAAIAQGVADGTISALYLIDEPSNSTWGGVFATSTLAGVHGQGMRLLDEMGRYADSLFPGTPTAVVGIAHLFKADSLPPFKYVDAIASQYDWWQGRASRIVGSGCATGSLTDAQKVRCWVDTMTAITKRKNAVPLFQMNIINGGIQPVNGVCPSTSGGKGTTGCRVTAAQLRDWGKELLRGCALVFWKNDPMLTQSAYAQSLRDLIAVANTRPRTSCSRQ